ncbi:hypothetical protein BC828DRAFT_386403, partial [Blastocladiella britannica]
VLDRILVFAAHRAYTLRDGLELLNVSARSDIPTTYSHIVRRLVPKHALGEMGRIDLLNMLEQPLSVNYIRAISLGAADAGHVHVLEWLCRTDSSRTLLVPTNGFYWPKTRDFRFLSLAAVKHAHTHVLDWCTRQSEPNFQQLLPELLMQATLHGQIRALDWMRTYATRCGLEYMFQNRISESLLVLSARHVAALDWWKADYAARPRELFVDIVAFPHLLACTGDDGLLVVHWWRAYCAEMNRKFTWPVLDQRALFFIVAHGSLSLCQWWWDDTAQQGGVLRAKDLLGGLLDFICEHGRAEFLSWWWDLCASSKDRHDFTTKWRPEHPFSHLRVIQWFEAEVASGKVDAAVFDIAPPKIPGELRLDKLFWSHNPLSPDPVIEMGALDWWWERRDRFNLLEACPWPRVHARLVASKNVSLLRRHLDYDFPIPVPPRMSLQKIANLVSHG